MGKPELSFDAEALLERFPPVEFVMAYGSGVFEQAGQGPVEGKMLDVILAVEDTFAWNMVNLPENTGDFPLASFLGGVYYIELLQRLGAKINYYPYIPMKDGREMKYGVISKANLLEDLKHWSTLYVAGRMHKPVEVFKEDPEVVAAMEANHVAALNAALLLLPEQFTLEALLQTIAGLSYTGDVRMRMAENPHKVKNIVEGNQEAMYELYKPHIAVHAALDSVGEDRFKRSTAPREAEDMWRALPNRVHTYHPDPPTWDQNLMRRTLEDAISRIVRGPSRVQAVKGVFTAGIPKSVRYGWAKRQKYLEG